MEAETTVKTDSQAETEYDPMDPNLTDLDNVIKRYDEEDAAKELAQKHMALGNDPKGGIDKISASSYAHN